MRNPGLLFAVVSDLLVVLVQTWQGEQEGGLDVSHLLAWLPGFCCWLFLCLTLQS